MDKDLEKLIHPKIKQVQTLATSDGIEEIDSEQLDVLGYQAQYSIWRFRQNHDIEPSEAVDIICSDCSDMVHEMTNLMAANKRIKKKTDVEKHPVFETFLLNLQTTVSEVFLPTGAYSEISSFLPESVNEQDKQTIKAAMIGRPLIGLVIYVHACPKENWRTSIGFGLILQVITHSLETTKHVPLCDAEFFLY